MQTPALPEIRFSGAASAASLNRPAVFVNGRRAAPNAVIRLPDGTRAQLLDLVMIWSRQPGRSQHEITAAQSYVSHFIEELR